MKEVSQMSKDYIIKHLSDYQETIDGYTFLNPERNILYQCSICWDVLRPEFDKTTQTVKIWKCTKHDEVKSDRS